MSGRWRMAVLALLSAGVFLLMPGRREFAASHEARVAQTAREMAASGWPWAAHKVEIRRVHLVKRLGVLRLLPNPEVPPMHVNPWVVPILTDEVRLQKPPLPYWCAAVLFKLFGASEAMARLVPCLLGAASTFLLYDLARLLYSQRVAWYAALVWLTCYLTIEYYRLAMADPYLAFFTLACVWAWIRGCTPTRRRGDAQTRGAEWGDITTGRSPRRDVGSSYSLSPASVSPIVLLFYLSLGLGALSKGPLILLHVAVPLALFHACFPRRTPRGWTSHLVGAVIFLAVALPWPLAVLHSVPNATELWRYESVGELSGENLESTQPWYFYVSTLYLILPWTAAWVLSLVWLVRRRPRRKLFPFGWCLLLVVVFSFVGQKKPPYLLPIAPAAALMIAVSLAPALRLARRWRMNHWPGAIVLVQTVIGIAIAIAAMGLVWPHRDTRWPAIIVLVAALVLAAGALREMLAVRPLGWFGVQTAAYLLVLLAYYHFHETPTNNDRSPKALCAELAPMIDGTHRALLVTKLPEEVAFYLPLHPAEGPAPSRYVVVIDDQKGVRDRARHKTTTVPERLPEEFQGWFSDAKVAAVRRVQINAAPGDARYKVYELTLWRSAFALN